MFNFFKTDQSAADLYIDLGTANTLIAARGKGIILNEPSLVAFTQSPHGAKKIIAVGNDAKEKLKNNMGNVFYLKPIRDGVVADFDSSEIMLREFLRRPQVSKIHSRPRVIVSMPYGVTEVEKKSIHQACKSAGAKQVYLIDEPMAAALGANIPVKSAKGHMLIDIGGGTTEVAVIALSDIIYCEPLKMGGHKLDDLILSYLKKKKKLVITEALAEELKLQMGTAVPKKDITDREITGRDLDTGLTKTVSITSEEIGLALNDGIEEIVNAVHRAIENTPPEIVSDIIENGIVLSGGGALIRDMALRIKNEVRLNVHVTDDPLLSIARGGEKLLDDLDLLEKVQIEL